MGTEVSRDLSDETRYNILPVSAACLSVHACVSQCLEATKTFLTPIKLLRRIYLETKNYTYACLCVSAFTYLTFDIYMLCSDISLHSSSGLVVTG